MHRVILYCLSMLLAFVTSLGVTAGQVYPGLSNDFENSSTEGWRKGNKSRVPPTIELDSNANHYLQIESFGDRVNGSDRSDPDSRMTFFNDGDWLGDYSTLGVISLKARMINLGQEPLHMVYGLGRDHINCATNSPIELPADSQWREVSFSLLGNDMICTDHDSGEILAGHVLNDALQDVQFNFFFSTEDPTDFSGKMIAVLGFDDVQAMTYPSLEFFENENDSIRPPVLDLASDIQPDTSLLTHIMETTELTSMDNAPILYSKDESSGLLRVQLGNTIENLRPVSAIQSENESPGMQHSPSGYKQFFTHNGRRIVFFPELLGSIEFDQELNKLNLRFEHDAQGNLQVKAKDFAPGNVWFSVRAAYQSIATTGTQPGLFAYEYEDLPSVSGYRNIITLENDFFQQDLYPVPANWESLRAYLVTLEGAEGVSLASDGTIQTTLQGTKYRGRMGYTVFPSDGTQSDATEMIPQGDKNGDGLVDFMVIYPDGQSQLLYLLP